MLLNSKGKQMWYEKKENFPNTNNSGNKENWDKEKVETFSMRAFIRKIQSTSTMYSCLQIHLCFFFLPRLTCFTHNPRTELSSNSCSYIVKWHNFSTFCNFDLIFSIFLDSLFHSIPICIANGRWVASVCVERKL